MSVAHAITVLFWLTAATLVVGLVRRARLWQAGQAAEVDWSGLLAIPKRYFVDLHHAVARDPYIAHTHVMTAGGAIAALVLVALNYSAEPQTPNYSDLGQAASLHPIFSSASWPATSQTSQLAGPVKLAPFEIYLADVKTAM